MKKSTSTILVSCKKASEMIEQHYVQPLPFSQQIVLRFHLGICKQCADYKKQSYLFDELFHRISTKKKELKPIENEGLKQRIIEGLNDQ